jgi:hypothetical protein
MEARIPRAKPGQVVIGTECWSCGTQLYKTVPLRRHGSGHVLWTCESCDVVWSSQAPRAA